MRDDVIFFAIFWIQKFDPWLASSEPAGNMARRLRTGRNCSGIRSQIALQMQLLLESLLELADFLREVWLVISCWISWWFNDRTSMEVSSLGYSPSKSWTEDVKQRRRENNAPDTRYARDVKIVSKTNIAIWFQIFPNRDKKKTRDSSKTDFQYTSIQQPERPLILSL